MLYKLRQMTVDAVQFNGYNIDAIRELASKYGIGVQPYAYGEGEDSNLLRYFELNYMDCYGRIQNKVVWTKEYVIRYEDGDCVSCDEETFNKRYIPIRRTIMTKPTMKYGEVYHVQLQLSNQDKILDTHITIVQYFDNFGFTFTFKIVGDESDTVYNSADLTHFKVINQVTSSAPPKFHPQRGEYYTAIIQIHKGGHKHKCIIRINETSNDNANDLHFTIVAITPIHSHRSYYNLAIPHFELLTKIDMCDRDM